VGQHSSLDYDDDIDKFFSKKKLIKLNISYRHYKVTQNFCVFVFNLLSYKLNSENKYEARIFLWVILHFYKVIWPRL
jgi:hypothetical protein